MAEQAERLTKWPDESELHHTGRAPVYPWDEWTDGGIWKVTRGKDFTCQTEYFRTTVLKQREKRGLACVTRITRDKESVVFQFTPVTE
jgi:hypothetical protein